MQSGHGRPKILAPITLTPALSLTLALALALAPSLTLALRRLGPRLSLVCAVAAQGEANPQTKESLMEKTNVYERAREVVRELGPIVQVIRSHDKALSERLRRAAQSVVLNIAEARGNDAGNARARFATACGSAKEVRASLHVASDWG